MTAQAWRIVRLPRHGGRTVVTVLLAEDEALISLDLEDSLSESGFAVAATAATCRAALTWLETATPDAAILDPMLADGCCIEVARLLYRRGVPLIFLSGGLAPRGMRDEFHGAVWFEKPADHGWIIRALNGLVEVSRERSSAGCRAKPFVGGAA